MRWRPLVVVPFLLIVAACGGSQLPAPSPAPPNSQAASASPTPVKWPIYPSAPETAGPQVVADFSNLAECDHPCTAPVRLGPGNSFPALIRHWPCEYYVAKGNGFCVDADKAEGGRSSGDVVEVDCLDLGNEDRQDGNLADDIGPTRVWARVIIPAAIAKWIGKAPPTTGDAQKYEANPALQNPPLAEDGTYRGYISTAWLRNANDPRGSEPFRIAAPPCPA